MTHQSKRYNPINKILDFTNIRQFSEVNINEIRNNKITIKQITKISHNID